MGRFITLDVEGDDPDLAGKDVDAMCRQLLANPIIEDYRFELEAADASGAAGRPAATPWTAADPYAHREEEIE